MTDPIRDAAITAAAQVRANANQPDRYWDRLTDGQRDYYRRMVTPLVDAVLAVAGPAYRAEALTEAVEQDSLTIRDPLGYNVRVVFVESLLDRADTEEADHV